VCDDDVCSSDVHVDVRGFVPVPYTNAQPLLGNAGSPVEFECSKLQTWGSALLESLVGWLVRTARRQNHSQF
jgi:hypothetical protein